MHLLGRTQRLSEIRTHLLNSVKKGQPDIVPETGKLFSVSRQTIHRHLAFLVANEWLISEGTTKNRIYKLGQKRFEQKVYDLRTIKEDVVYRNDFSFVFENAPKNIDEICYYGFTEMVNNAIDHSGGARLFIEAETNKEEVIIKIYDDGEGIFKRIARLKNLEDPRESILELSKGKLTTDPDNHTGEGIFFTSRAFDEFVIFSDDLDFRHHSKFGHDWLLHASNKTDGTNVGMRINLGSKTTLESLYNEFSSGPDDYAFDKTIVPVQLALYEGDRLVSRSQARRILNRVEKFTYVILDFEGVDSIGQAFADEVFRVFSLAHPKLTIEAVNAVENVIRMINRAKSV